MKASATEWEASSSPFLGLCHLLSMTVNENHGSVEGAETQWPIEYWSDVVALASEHCVLTWLATRCHDDQVDCTIPSDIAHFFADVRELNQTRNEQFVSAASHVIQIANGFGIEPVLLKGSAFIIGKHYPQPAGRFLSDVDLLVRDRGTQERLVEKLIDAGFRFRDGAQRVQDDDRHHAPPLLDPIYGAPVEIHHRSLSTRENALGLDYGTLRSRAKLVVTSGGSAYLPCAEDMLVHSLVHFQISHRWQYLAEIKLRDAIDFHQLLHKPEAQDILDNSLERVAKGGFGPVVYGFVTALNQLVPGSVCPSMDRLRLAAKWHKERYLRRYRLSSSGKFSWSSVGFALPALLQREWYQLRSSASHRQLWIDQFSDLSVLVRRLRTGFRLLMASSGNDIVVAKK